MLAHFAYLASGGLCGRGKVILLGVTEEVDAAPAAMSVQGQSLAGPGSSSHATGGVNLRKMGDVRILSAVRMTEVFERAVMLFEDSGTSSKTASSIGTSLTSMLGLGGSGRKGADASDHTAGDITRELKLHRLSGDTIMKCRIALCPHKVRLALWLADLGLTEAAYAYAMEAKVLVQLVSAGQADGSAKPATGKGKPPVPTKGGEGGGKSAVFSRGFVNTLQEFLDRLSGGSEGGEGGAQSS